MTRPWTTSPPTVTLTVRRPVGERAFVQVRGAFYNEDECPGPTEVRMPATRSSTRWVA